ncbi:uracil-DNA glycosylase [Varunaivibrio sulfuroxidans]|uniref:Type-4 uracil-DNA glycosylase n=1 Tax=Varunaivibrio sulfuroxidans TaxID=1773489 RepID=A0A4R3JEC0_9PROT|nr:uracil-DNA glycosylase [Varunaivibrio sulfuroxidans]TCS63553.1 DNA polymerase [Varunaivibrio sulfuroxidans]WES30302.1 uracil-DNA glycosylase [Varunaivibrio sulfuroxidans]
MAPPENSSGAMFGEDMMSDEDVLRWYVLAGVDETIDDAAHDRFAEALSGRGEPGRRVYRSESQASAMPLASSSPPSPPPSSTFDPSVSAPQMQGGGRGSIPGADASVKSAVALARAAETLEALRAAVTDFDGCPLKRTAMSTVFGDGAPDAKLVLIGEAPGADEDRQGVPFVGASGQLLDRMLASIGLDRSTVFISNTVFWRPPGNRTPTSSEIAVCQPFVERLIELIDPRILVTVGGPASHSLLAQKGGMSRLRGRWFTFSTPRLGHPVPATAIFHPAYLLRSPEQKRLAWRDLLAIREKLEHEESAPS